MTKGSPSRFETYVGIDYSGAASPISSLKGLRAFHADGCSRPLEVQPPSTARKYWTRRGVAGWLADILASPRPVLVGIDHGFSFPMLYFDTFGVPYDWTTFLDDFRAHWPTDDDDVSVQRVREGAIGNGPARLGDPSWRRLTEVWARASKSVFQFDVEGSVAKSTHAGLPWLRHLRAGLGARVHFWPFDGWSIPAGKSVLVEVYPSLWKHEFAREDRSADQHDAFVVAAWLQRADLTGTLRTYLGPALSPEERGIASIEGWILGVGGTWQPPSHS